MSEPTKMIEIRIVVEVPRESQDPANAVHVVHEQAARLVRHEPAINESNDVGSEHAVRVSEVGSGWLDHLDEHLDWRRRRGHADAVVAQARASIEHLMLHCEAPTFSAVTSAHIQSWIRLLQDRGVGLRSGKPKPCSNKTVNEHLGRIRQLFKFLVQFEAVKVSPVHGILNLPVVTEEASMLTSGQMQALIRVASEDEWSDSRRHSTTNGEPKFRWAAYVLMSLTGIRKGTAQKLRWRHFKFGKSHAKLVIPASLMKSRRPSEKTIADPFASALEAHRDRRAAAGWGGEPDDLLVSGGFLRYEPLRGDALAAGIELTEDQEGDIGYHWFRHAFGSQMMAELGEGELATVSKLMDHRSIETTMRYLHTTKDKMRQASIKRARSMESKGFLKDALETQDENSEDNDGESKNSHEQRGPPPTPIRQITRAGVAFAPGGWPPEQGGRRPESGVSSSVTGSSPVTPISDSASSCPGRCFRLFCQNLR